MGWEDGGGGENGGGEGMVLEGVGGWKWGGNGTGGGGWGGKGTGGEKQLGHSPRLLATGCRDFAPSLPSSPLSILIVSPSFSPSFCLLA